MTLRTLYQYGTALTRPVTYCTPNRFAHAPWREAPSAPPLGELLSEREAEGVRYDIRNISK